MNFVTSPSFASAQPISLQVSDAADCKRLRDALLAKLAAPLSATAVRIFTGKLAEAITGTGEEREANLDGTSDEGRVFTNLHFWKSSSAFSMNAHHQQRAVIPDFVA